MLCLPDWWPGRLSRWRSRLHRGRGLNYPGEIAVWSTVLTQKQDYCRRQARARKLTYLKRRRFVRACVKREMGERN